ncbi:dihydrolipoamide dehydrogenase [Desulfacinum hydrothermale DSM 13146]|uniref:Dihydrolipoyl dehydrogenase n=1 Tax=Desulfacinum hydrothermale DSM 13146 TaxID=1121390 RepID=A0A1W1XN65_9BACT|nr:dihydrolipoyl dehydrogenase [Desulfacinum hydrothermale]SMC25356.1 dihydrolipoamide dehydrogenase [Desulfacinum hydrothermale DSM 13146]
MTEENRYDLVVIGSGPGGYVACVRAAQLGLRVACVERYARLGGVCLNVGCIPSKALLDSSEHYATARHRLAEHGVRVDAVELDLAAMMARKDRVVGELTENVRKLLERHKVQILAGTARMAGPGKVRVESADAPPVELQARAVILATGSEPVQVPSMPFDGRFIVSSTQALGFERVPERLGIVGGGYIGLELGSVWNRVGSQVTVIEMLPRVASLLDAQVSRTLERLLRRQGFQFLLESRVEEAVVEGDAVRVCIKTPNGEEERGFDRLLVAVGRRPLTRGLGLEALGVETDPKSGHIRVDVRYQTTVPGVYAIGDLVAGPMLAHKASAEAIACVEGIAGLESEVNYDAVPSIIYTWPEVASVGKTEEELKELQVPYCIGTYPFAGAGRARCMGETDGFVKVLSHAGSGRVLGVHIIGPRASDMIAEAVLAVECGATAQDLGRIMHGHPTFSEALQEAARVATACAIYGRGA